MASIKKRGNTYSIVDYKPDKEQITIALKTTEKLKADKIKKIIETAKIGALSRDDFMAAADKIMGWTTPTSKVIGQIEELYFSKKRNVSRDETYRLKSSIKRLAIFFGEDFPICDVTPELAQNFMDVSHPINEADPASILGKTYNCHLSRYIIIFKRISVKAKLQTNPFTFLDREDELGGKTGRDWSKAEQSFILEGCQKDGHDWYAVSLIGKRTAMRKSDCIFLHRRNIVKGKNGWTIKTKPGKTLKHNIEVNIPIVTKLESIILPRLETQVSFLFPEAIRNFNYHKAKRYPTIVRESGVKDKGAICYFNNWRHTARTELEANGASIEDAMALLGHSNKAMSKHYSHSDQEMRELLEQIA
jgi:integrase